MDESQCFAVISKASHAKWPMTERSLNGMWKYGSASSSASFVDRKADWFDSFLSRDRSHFSSISASSFEMAVSVYAWFTFITQEKGKWSANGTHLRMFGSCGR